MKKLAAICVVVLLGAAPPATGAIFKNRGKDGRYYVGARWSPTTAETLGYAADLELRKAQVHDLDKGGYIAQTLWVATNDSTNPYGASKPAPYISVSISRGYGGNDGVYLVLAVKTAKGKYSEYAWPGYQYGISYVFSVTQTHPGCWQVSLQPDPLADICGTGINFYSSSVFAGIESTSKGNFAEGTVDRLYWLVPGQPPAPFPRWRVESQPDLGAQLVSRGNAFAAWEDEQYSFRDRFGKRR
jgi:hypothetical protein